MSDALRMLTEDERGYLRRGADIADTCAATLAGKVAEFYRQRTAAMRSMLAEDRIATESRP